MWGDTCMKYDCLIIDDEEVLAKNTCEYFNMFDVKTFVTFSVAGAETFFKENDASLLLLDINLGDGSGFEFCKKIRESKNIPILFISATALTAYIRRSSEAFTADVQGYAVGGFGKAEGVYRRKLKD